MTYFLCISSIAIGLFFKKSKIVTAYILSAMFVLAAFNNFNADYNNYIISYGQSAIPGSAYRYLGYTSWVRLFAVNGIVYSAYLKFAFLFLLILLFIGIRILTDRPNVVLALYMLFSFGVDVVQLKTYYSEIFALIGLAILFRAMSNRQRKRPLLQIAAAVLMGILSTAFHFSGIYYLIVGAVFYISFRNRKFKWRIMAIALFAFVLVYTGLISKVMSLASSLGLISNTEYLAQYTQRATRYGFIIPSLGIILMIMTCQKLDVHWNAKLVILQSFMFTAMLLVPLLTINWAYDRLARIYMIILYIIYSKQKYSLQLNRRQLYSTLLLVASIGFMFCIDVYSCYDGTLGAVLNNSELLL